MLLLGLSAFPLAPNEPLGICLSGGAPPSGMSWARGSCQWGVRELSRVDWSRCELASSVPHSMWGCYGPLLWARVCVRALNWRVQVLCAHERRRLSAAHCCLLPTVCSASLQQPATVCLRRTCTRKAEAEAEAHKQRQTSSGPQNGPVLVCTGSQMAKVRLCLGRSSPLCAQSAAGVLVCARPKLHFLPADYLPSALSGHCNNCSNCSNCSNCCSPASQLSAPSPRPLASLAPLAPINNWPSGARRHPTNKQQATTNNQQTRARAPAPAGRQAAPTGQTAANVLLASNVS